MPICPRTLQRAPGHGHIDGPVGEHGFEIGKNAADAVADPEQVPALFGAETVVIAQIDDSNPGGAPGTPGRAIAAGIPLLQPAQLFDGGLRIADFLQPGPGAEAEPAQNAEPMRTASIFAICGYLNSAEELQQWTIPVSWPWA